MSTTPKTKKETAEEITDKVLEVAAQIHKIHEPQWNARADVLKTIVSLSSASIVLSVTFSSSLRTLQINTRWRYLLVASFALFVLSLVIAFVALRLSTLLYEVQSTMLGKRTEMQESLMKASTADEYMETFKGILNRSFQPLERNDKLANRLFNISFIIFCLAVASLATVGAVQLLS